MTLRVVLDVNILASAMVSPEGLPALVLRAGLERRYRIVRSDHIMETLVRTLEKPYFRTHTDPDQVQQFLIRIVRLSENVDRDDGDTQIAPDAEDDKVLGAAVRAGATYLVTGDRRFRLLEEHRGVRIVSLEDFVQLEQRLFST